MDTELQGPPDSMPARPFPVKRKLLFVVGALIISFALGVLLPMAMRSGAKPHAVPPAAPATSEAPESITISCKNAKGKSLYVMYFGGQQSLEINYFDDNSNPRYVGFVLDDDLGVDLYNRLVEKTEAKSGRISCTVGDIDAKNVFSILKDLGFSRVFQDLKDDFPSRVGRMEMPRRFPIDLTAPNVEPKDAKELMDDYCLRARLVRSGVSGWDDSRLVAVIKQEHGVTDVVVRGWLPERLTRYMPADLK